METHWSKMFAGFVAHLGASAEIYIIWCTLAFWLGYLLFGQSTYARRLHIRGRIRVRLGDNAMLNWSLLFAGIAALCAILYAGGPAHILYNPTGEVPSVGGAMFSYGWLVHVLDRFVVTLLIALSSALLGFGWPEAANREAHHWLLGSAILILNTTLFMSHFSRGTPLPAVIAIMAYTFKTWRVPRLATVALTVWVVIAMNSAAWGRGYYGHNAGAIPFVQACGHTIAQLLTGNFRRPLDRVAILIDSLTPTTVVMAAANAGVNINPLSPWHWILFQIPLPHFLIPGPKWTLDATLFLGGTGGWGYTAGMFGDTFATFGWLGAWPFFFVGMLYRFIDQLAGPEGQPYQGSVSIFALMLPISYLAAGIGSFGAFRSLMSLTVFSLLALWLAVHFMHGELTSNPQPYPTPQPRPAPRPPSTPPPHPAAAPRSAPQ